MTTPTTPIKLETTDLDDIQKEVQALKTRMNNYRTKSLELQKQIKELDKLYKEDEEKLKKIQGEDKIKKEKADAIKKLLLETSTSMDGLENDLDETIALIELPPKDSFS